MISRDWPRHLDPWVALLTVAGAAARIVAADRLPWIAFDTVQYIAQAEALGAGRCDNFFPNGFPALLAATSAVTPDGWHPEAFIGVNVVVSGLTVPLSAALARALGGGPGSQRAAAAAVAFWPTQVNAAGYILTEAPSTCLLLAAVLALARGHGAGAALLLGSVSVMRTSLAPAAMALLLMAWLMKSRRPSRVVPVLATLLVPALALGMVCVPRGGTWGLGSNFSYNVSLSHVRTVGSEPEGPDDAMANTWEYVGLVWAHPRRMLHQRGLELLEMWGPTTPLDPARPVRNQLLIGFAVPADPDGAVDDRAAPRPGAVVAVVDADRGSDSRARRHVRARALQRPARAAGDCAGCDRGLETSASSISGCPSGRALIIGDRGRG